MLQAIFISGGADDSFKFVAAFVICKTRQLGFVLELLGKRRMLLSVKTTSAVTSQSLKKLSLRAKLVILIKYSMHAICLFGV